MADTDAFPDLAPSPEPASVAVRAARAWLKEPEPVRSPLWPLLAAAALAAGAGLSLAAAVIMGPPHLGPDVTLNRDGAPLDTSP
jgi:hypothetical protein